MKFPGTVQATSVAIVWLQCPPCSSSDTHQFVYKRQDDDQEHIDHRDQIDFRLFLAAPALKIHHLLPLAVRVFDETDCLLLHLDDETID